MKRFSFLDLFEGVIFYEKYFKIQLGRNDIGICFRRGFCNRKQSAVE